MPWAMPWGKAWGMPWGRAWEKEVENLCTKSGSNLSDIAFFDGKQLASKSMIMIAGVE